MTEDTTEEQRQIFADKLAECDVATGHITLTDDDNEALLEDVCLTPKQLRCVADAIELSQRLKFGKHGISKFLGSMQPDVELFNGFTVSWSEPDVGFGQFHFYIEDGKVHCSNECMSKRFIKKVLNDLVDECVLDEK